MKKLFIAVLLVAATLSWTVVPVLAANQTQAEASVESQINVNTATLKELSKLPGIGKVTAERIIAYRDTNGPFASVDALGKVKGVGKKTLEKIRPIVVVE